MSKRKSLEPDQQPEGDKKDEEESCVICMATLGEQARGTIKCSHSFCFECILNWSKVTNSCPLCKVRFFGINEIKGTKTRRVKVKAAEQEASYGPEEYGEEVYGDAQDYLAQEEEEAARAALPFLGFVGFGLGTYNEDEDEDFVDESSSSSSGGDENVSSVASDEILLLDSDAEIYVEAESESESDFESDFSSRGDRDSLGDIWGSNAGNASFRGEGASLASSSSTPRRPRTRNNNSARRPRPSRRDENLPPRRNPSRLAKKNDPLYDEPQRDQIRMQGRRRQGANSNRPVEIDLLSSDDSDYSGY